MYDTLILVPFESIDVHFNDPVFRRTLGAHLSLPIGQALAELESYVGRSLSFWDHSPLFSNGPIQFPAHRSLTAITLASNLEKANIKWKAVDPGIKQLDYWRKIIKKESKNPPATVCISTTFTMNAIWLKELCKTIRKALPHAKLIVGGYYYGTSTREFLELDADVYCIGEGENRLVQIIQNLLHKKPLNGIEGLYLKNQDGSLHYTGDPRPIDLEGLQAPDWSLAEKMIPPTDYRCDQLEYAVETQRGCIFKCGFCTYRTITLARSMSPEAAAQAILATRTGPKGYINISDATATFPHKRWNEIMSKLIEAGGSPYPIWAFARVSDINEEGAQLMYKAGVRQLFIGQESGDQDILNAMKKGTRVEQVNKAVQILGKNSIAAMFSFMHGYPGETQKTIQNTRTMIQTLNDSCKNKPVVVSYFLYPFIYMDFAAISQDESLKDVNNMMGYENSTMKPRIAIEEVLNTVIAASKIAHAPPFSFYLGAAPPTTTVSLFCNQDRYEIFHWLKKIERGMTIFLERDLEGKKINDLELNRIKADILTPYEKVSRKAFSSLKQKIKSATMASSARKMRKEWINETERGVGFTTKSLLASNVLRDTGSVKAALKTMLSGNWPQIKALEETDQKETLANDMINEAMSVKSSKKLRSQSV